MSRAQLELYKGSLERAAQQTRLIQASIDNAKAYDALKGSTPSFKPEYKQVQFPPSSMFDRNGYYTVIDTELDHKEAGRRWKFHREYVLPTDCALAGHIRTGLKSDGTPTEKYEPVNVEEYFRRYRLWRKRGSLSFFYRFVSADEYQLREVTGYKSPFRYWLWSKFRVVK